MTKNKNHKNIAFWIFGIMSITLTFIACRKNFTESANDIFSQSEAKEWYYGIFKKSPEWQQSNEKGEKLPDWKNGTYRRVGNMEIVEFPLMKERKTYSIPSASKLSSSEIRKITDGSLSRIAFIRAANNEIVVRELDYIPDIDFLKVKGYDISDIRLGNKENNFSGRIITKKWDGTILSTRKFENGKISFESNRLGKFVIQADSTPPAVIKLAISHHGARFRIYDNLSGISHYEARINGNWVLLNYDYKTGILATEKKDKNMLLQGDFLLQVTDNCGNIKTFKIGRAHV